MRAGSFVSFVVSGFLSSFVPSFLSFRLDMYTPTDDRGFLALRFFLSPLKDRDKTERRYRHI